MRFLLITVLGTSILVFLLFYYFISFYSPKFHYSYLPAEEEVLAKNESINDDFCNVPSLPHKYYTDERNRYNRYDMRSANYLVTFSRYRAGLGNWMFQFASMIGIAKKLGYKPVLTPSISKAEFSLLDVFQIKTAQMSTKDYRKNRWREIKANCCCCHEQIPYFNETNIKLSGFFQSFRYFKEVEELVKSEFNCRYHLQIHAEEKRLTLLTKYCPNITCILVGIHIRRGDMLDSSVGFKVASRSYLTKAMQFYTEKYTEDNLLFVVIGEDLDWNLDALRDSKYLVTVSEPCSTGQDFCFLRRCDHSIITVGTFGWWVGYLASGDVVYYGNYTTPNSLYSKEITPNDYFPPNWVPIYD